MSQELKQKSEKQIIKYYNNLPEDIRDQKLKEQENLSQIIKEILVKDKQMGRRVLRDRVLMFKCKEYQTFFDYKKHANKSDQ